MLKQIVEIILITSLLSSAPRKACIYLTQKRGTAMPTSNLEVLRKPVNTDGYGNSSPRYMRENHYAILVFTYEISQVSKLQDKHNASLISKMSLDRLLHPTAKILNLFDRRIIYNVISAKAHTKKWRPSSRVAISYII